MVQTPYQLGGGNSRRWANILMVRGLCPQRGPGAEGSAGEVESCSLESDGYSRVTFAWRMGLCLHPSQIQGYNALHRKKHTATLYILDLGACAWPPCRLKSAHAYNVFCSEAVDCTAV